MNCSPWATPFELKRLPFIGSGGALLSNDVNTKLPEASIALLGNIDVEFVVTRNSAPRGTTVALKHRMKLLPLRSGFRASQPTTNSPSASIAIAGPGRPGSLAAVLIGITAPSGSPVRLNRCPSTDSFGGATAKSTSSHATT